MNQELEDISNLEREKIKATMVAVNPQLYDSIYNPQPESLVGGEIEWITPKSMEEADALARELEGVFTGSESSV